MLDISWVFANHGSFRELIVALNESPYEAIFSTDLVITMTKIFDQKYKSAIWWRCFIPYMVYFLCTIYFYTVFTSPGIHSSSENEKLVALIMGLIIICLDLYFLFYELVIVMRDGTKYLNSVVNFVDMITAFINMWLVYQTFKETEFQSFSE